MVEESTQPTKDANKILGYFGTVKVTQSLTRMVSYEKSKTND